MNRDQRLGIKVFYYYLSNKVIAGILLLVVYLIFYSFKAEIVLKLHYVLSSKTSILTTDYAAQVLLIFSLVVLSVGVLISWLDYISCTFSLGEYAFIIKRGIFNKKEVSIPYRQIQDIDIEQSFHNKLMGVSKLVVLSAGNDDNDKEGESEGIFEIIDSDIAHNLRDDLLQRTSIQMVKEIKANQ